MNNPAESCAIKFSAGISLVEVLIALFVLSVGLLGTLALTTQSIQATSNALHRNSATMLAAELADRIRANVPGADANAYIYPNETYPSSIDCSDNSQRPAQICSMTPDHSSDDVAACDATQMARWDYYELSCVNGTSGDSAVLPLGTLQITCDDADTLDDDACTNGSPHVITITWQEKNLNTRDTVELTVVPGEVKQ